MPAPAASNAPAPNSSSTSSTPGASTTNASTTNALASGAGLMLLAMICQELGASLAVKIFPQVGALGAVALRLVLSTVVLAIVVRPHLRGITPRAWRTAIVYGLALAAMNSSFYLALERLHLGVTVTIEVLGPMVLSIVLARRWLNVLWVALAVGGVALLSQGPVALDPVGVAFALVAATMWALYILSAQRAGREFPGMDGLAIAMAVGSLAILPFAAVSTGATLIQPNILLLGLGIALLSSTLPYAMELFALKRIPASLFSILLAFAPAVAALAGWAVLGQTMVWAQWAGIALVIVASVGAVRMTRRQGLDA